VDVQLARDVVVSDGCARRRHLGDDICMDDPVAACANPDIPRIPASAGALIFDEAGRLLILKPNYKQGWTIPGGQVDANGESPWDACRRETLEECGLEVEHARLVCVDFLAPRPQRPDAAHRPGGVRFLFDCGMLSDERFKTITLQAEEIDEYRLAEMGEALTLLSGPLRRRVSKAASAKRCLYLENGRRVRGVSR
jgi:8-oxo-dGTP pyrophosphatase MutT (NUDIX family)